MLKTVLAALLVAGAAGVVVPMPAAAQEASPRPPCGAPATMSVAVEPAALPAPGTATVTVTVRDEPCYGDESVAHPVDVFVQRPGTRDPAPLASGSTDRSGRLTVQDRVEDGTTTYYAGVRDGLRRGGSSSATVRVGCPVLTLEGGTAPVVVNGPVDLVGRSSDPASTYRLEVVRPVLGPARSGSGTATPWTVRPAESTVVRMRSTVRGQYGCLSAPVHLRVVPALSLTVRQLGPQAFAFVGRVLPGRQQLVTLYRVDGGRRTILVQRRAEPDGAYSLDRSFLVPGRYAVRVGVSSTATNLGGTSAVRELVAR